ncbi:hypothetical protein [Pontibacter cellulosilyticus]|uniref:DUF4369 domain-containing protein n=1 Tax=Pontibacter cellulosilyticus TaxID=1720253 RepID=A0A923N8W5_9BACT|nr:hypothetical protein [Pontibacter cellulosilyticus]MBC5995055.1 hypothetical protein [Pontibacter cellulosilyticus]
MKKNLTALTIVCVIFIGLSFNAAFGQIRTAIDVQEWPKGKVVLVNGDTLYGALTYYRTPEIVKVHHQDGSISSVSPVNVEYFIAQEMPSGRSFTFKSLHWDLGKPYSDFKKPTFFEELNRGALTLIMRETYVKRDAGRQNTNLYRNAPSYYGGNNFYEQVKELYYIMLPDGEILPLKNVRKDLHTLFGEKSKNVKSYIKLNKLDYEKPHELIAIINYFNALSSSTSRAF